MRVNAQKGSPVSENLERDELTGKTRDLSLVDETMTELVEETTIGEEGAEDVVADTVHIDQGSVKNVQAETVEVKEGAILHVEADSVEIQEGAIGLAQAETVTLQQGAVGVAIADKIEVTEGPVLFAAAQELGGGSQVIVDLKAALVFGAVVGVVSGLIRALVGRKK